MKKYGGKRREKSKMEIGYVVLDLNPQLCCSTDKTNFDPSAVACKCFPGCLSYIPSKEELLPPPPSFWPNFFFSPSRGDRDFIRTFNIKVGGYRYG